MCVRTLCCAAACFEPGVYFCLSLWACLEGRADALRGAYPGWGSAAAPSPSCHLGPYGLEVEARHEGSAWCLPCQLRVGAEGVAAQFYFSAVRVEALPGMVGIRAPAKCPGGMPHAHGGFVVLLHVEFV